MSQIKDSSASFGWDVTETLENVPDLDSNSNRVPHAAKNKYSPSATTTPPAQWYYAYKTALGGSSFDIDLTALPTTQGNVNATGKKVRGIRIRAAATHACTVAPGAANGYQLNGANSIVVPAGGDMQMYFADALVAVDGTHKILTITATVGDVPLIQLLVG